MHRIRKAAKDRTPIRNSNAVAYNIYFLDCNTWGQIGLANDLSFLEFDM
jgi:hypothetical protein